MYPFFKMAAVHHFGLLWQILGHHSGNFGPGTDSAGPGNIKLLNQFGSVFLWIVVNLVVVGVQL